MGPPVFQYSVLFVCLLSLCFKQDLLKLDLDVRLGARSRGAHVNIYLFITVIKMAATL
jgi:hypothetical protein